MVGTGSVATPNTPIDLGTWQPTRQSVQQYTSAVGDTQGVYFDLGLVPPLALSAWALGALLEKMSLPAGAIHSLQELEQFAPVEFDGVIRGVATVERPRRRGNLEFITAAIQLTDAAGQVVQTGKTTVLVAGVPPE